MAVLSARAVPVLVGLVVVGLAAAAGCAGGTAGGGRAGRSPGPEQPAGAVRQVFFDPQDLFTPDTRSVLTGPADVAGFVTWVTTHPVPGRASDRLVTALRRYRFDGTVLVVVARTVGCDSVGRVELQQHGAAWSVATFDVRHHPECLRANHLVAVFAVPAAALPVGISIDGSPPDTRWR